MPKGLDHNARLTHDLNIMTSVAREAGALALRFRAREFRTWDKSPGDPVCEADIAVNDLLKTQLIDARPSYGWLSEESQDGHERLTKEWLWVVDPIDGTRAYIKGRNDYVISIALLHHCRPVLACLYQPDTDTMYHSQSGKGAFCNDIPLSVSSTDTLTASKMLVDKDVFRSSFWPEPWPDIYLEKPNSIALRLALVAQGKFDAAFALRPKNDWDLAAAGLLVEEAGGRLSDEAGRPLRYNQEKPSHPTLIASNTALYDMIQKRVSAGYTAWRERRKKS